MTDINNLMEEISKMLSAEKELVTFFATTDFSEAIKEYGQYMEYEDPMKTTAIFHHDIDGYFHWGISMKLIDEDEIQIYVHNNYTYDIKLLTHNKTQSRIIRSANAQDFINILNKYSQL